MTTPLQQLYQKALEQRERGSKVMSTEYVINMIDAEVSRRLVEASERMARQSV